MTGPEIPTSFTLAVRHHQDGRLAEAEKLYREILQVQPAHCGALHLLGVVTGQMGDHTAAVELIRQAIALHSTNADYYCNLGKFLIELGQEEAATAACRQAIVLKPDLADAHLNLGVALKGQDQLDAAVRSFRRTISLKPDYAEAHSNLGVALHSLGQLDAAKASLHKALALKPDCADACWNLALSELLEGNFQQGWIEYERRLSFEENVWLTRRFPQPHWNGEDLPDRETAFSIFPSPGSPGEGQGEGVGSDAISSRPSPSQAAPARPLPEYRERENASTQNAEYGCPKLDGRTILLIGEQGFGDTIQFIRYAPLVAEHVGKVVVMARPELQRLLRRAAGIDQVLSQDDPVPPLDVQCPLLSLPRIFGTTLETIPAEIPYLSADPELVRRWSTRFDAADDRKRIGLAWAGSPTHKGDRIRSISPKLLSPLQTADVRFFSLQKGAAATQTNLLAARMEITDWTQDLSDFADAAALIANLDLVISVDTAVAHLAGAMGKPVWVMLPYLLDWRWLMNRADSPWYPTMRLFRQPARGDWKSVIGAVGKDLHSRYASQPERSVPAFAKG